ncbi:MAG: cytochrome C biogenesis protein, partial [Paenibacillaceae bacterium ZCTH02-B3]
MNEINVGIAFLAGLASFVSPCCLPLYPSYLSYITGVGVRELKDMGTRSLRLRTLSHAVAFVAGLSVVFYTLGFGAGAFGDFFKQYQTLISRLSAVLIVAIGLFLLGVFRPRFLMKERRLNLRWKPVGHIGTFAVGVGFAAGWTPCVGPILTFILNLALIDPGSWFAYMTAYCLGFAVPFVALAFFLGSVKWLLKYSERVMKIGGSLMVAMGILLYTGQFMKLSAWLNAITPAWL